MNVTEEQVNSIQEAIDMIIGERIKQCEKGHNQEHDKGHFAGELAATAALVCYPYRTTFLAGIPVVIPAPNWAASIVNDHSGDYLSRLRIAGALIVAEMERVMSEGAGFLNESVPFDAIIQLNDSPDGVEVDS